MDRTGFGKVGLVVAVVMLVSLFAGPAGAQMMGHEGMMGPMGPGRHGPGYGAAPFDLDFMRDVLGLSEDQVAKLEKLRSEYRKEMIRRGAERRIAELELWELIGAKDLDLGKAEKKVKQIEAIRSDIMLYRIKTLQETRKFLTEEQYERFRDMGFRSLQRMMGRHGMMKQRPHGGMMPGMGRGMMPGMEEYGNDYE